MSPPRPATTVVLLPGTGSDDDFVRRAFASAVAAAGARLVAVAPDPRDLIGGYRRALRDAARLGPVAVGGVSIGAAVAAAWALRHPRDVTAVIAALPAWSGPSDHAAAAAAARLSAAALRRDGLDAVTGAWAADTPPWLAAELTRAWTRQWPHLPDALEEAAAFTAPTPEQIGALEVPLAVVGALDDAVHPASVARSWAHAAPRGALTEVTLAAYGADPGVLGAASLAAWEAALSRR